jgi:hypothetical protein
VLADGVAGLGRLQRKVLRMRQPRAALR